MNKEQFNILIADDNPNNLKILSKIIKEMGHKIRVANNGKQVLKSVKLQSPDLILLDIHMPEMDGYDTCKALKADKKSKEIPVIFISALSETFNIVKAFQLGGAEYITKPFQIEEVKARINVQLLLKHQTVKLEKTIELLKSTQMQLVISEKMAAIGQLTAGIAHEINNPISFIWNSSAAMEKDVNDLIELNHKFKKALAEGTSSKADIEKIEKELDASQLEEVLLQEIRDIQEGARRTSEIVKGLQMFSRKEKQKKTEVPLHEVIESALNLLKGKWSAEIELEKKFDPKVKSIVGHPGQLGQVFLNILTNALDAIKKKGKIVITTKKLKDKVVISFQDSGSGISKEIRTKIFDPFFTTKDVGEGTGLGLSISHGIILNHGGKIVVESEEGKGTTFTVEIPLGTQTTKTKS